MVCPPLPPACEWITPRGPYFFPELWIFLRIEVSFRFFLGVEVVEVAEELIEPMIRRQMLVIVWPDVVLAENPAESRIPASS